MWKFGIEHEVAFLRPDNSFADFGNTTNEEFQAILADLPKYAQDVDLLRVDRFNIMEKRWYIEGYERFNEDGSLKKYLPKGIEIRTTPKSSIKKCLKELNASFRLLCKAARRHGFTPIWLSYHPLKTSFVPEPPFSSYEKEKLKQSPEDRTEYIAMLTFGPDLNISLDLLSDSEVVEIGKKLTYYSPFIVPFSFSSPLYEGKVWDGYSIRTFIRTGDRHAARVFISDEKVLIPDNPLTRLARIPIEAKRIEFKSPDAIKDPNIYAGLLALLKGLILDQSLKGRAITTDKSLHQLSARKGLNDPKIYEGACAIIKAAEEVLKNDPDRELLEPLKKMLQEKSTPAQEIIDQFKDKKNLKDHLKLLEYGQKFV